MSKKIPFSIKYRPQIESGEYKVETRDGRPVKIVSFEITDSGELPIAAQFRLCAGTPVIYLFDKNGEYKGEGPSDYDLFLITPDPELAEFEQAVRGCITKNLTTHAKGGNVEASSTVYIDDETTKKMAAELIELARKEIESEIKEQVVHDYWRLSADLQSQARADGKAEALKDLPRWKKIGRGNNYSSEVKFAINGRYLEMNDTLNDVYEVALSNLEKLPKED